MELPGHPSLAGDLTGPPGITRPRDYERVSPGQRQLRGTTCGMCNLE